MDDMTVEVVADGIHVPPTIPAPGLQDKRCGTDVRHHRCPGMCGQRQQRAFFDPRVIIEDGVCKLADPPPLPAVWLLWTD